MESAKVAKQKNLSLMSGFCWRSSLPERATYAKIHEGEIGAIRTVYATYNGSPNPFVDRTAAMSDMEWQIRNWYHYLWLGGDHIVEQACHSVDKINWAFNNEAPVRCWAVGGRAQRSDKHPGNIFDHFGVTYEYKDNRRGFLQARQWEGAGVDNDNTDWVYGEKGIARINGWGPEHWIKGDKTWRYEGDHVNMYVHEHEEFFAGIRNGKPRNDGDWMTQSTLMAIMGRMAAYTGKAVTWEQALNSTERVGPTEYAFGPVATSAIPRPGFTKFT
jgi:myo-inositol 2-dehydrogenase / D-chiro-inositol 1-dehydrogenase